MATFTYKAIDSSGRETVDKLIAADRASAIEEIYGRKLCPVSVEKAEEARSHGWLSRIGGVSKREIDAFTRQLANLLAAGVPMSRALGILSREASRTASKKLWATVHDHVSGGMALARCLEPASERVLTDLCGHGAGR